MEQIFSLIKNSDKKPVLRLTSQRKAIVGVLWDEQNKHLTVEDIHSALSKQGEKLGVATIYRNLLKLEELGIVNKLDLGGGRFHYELVSKPNSFHYHLVCQKCGAIMEVEDPVSYQTIQATAGDLEFKISQVELIISGYCRNCQEAI